MYCYMVHFNSPLVREKCRYCNTLSKKQHECLGHFQSPARMKALLQLLDSAIYFYTRDNHASNVNLNTAMPHADITDFPATLARTQ